MSFRRWKHRVKSRLKKRWWIVLLLALGAALAAFLIILHYTGDTDAANIISPWGRDS